VTRNSRLAPTLFVLFAAAGDRYRRNVFPAFTQVDLIAAIQTLTSDSSADGPPLP